MIPGPSFVIGEISERTQTIAGYLLSTSHGSCFFLDTEDTLKSKKDKDTDFKELIFKLRKQKRRNYQIHQYNSYMIVRYRSDKWEASIRKLLRRKRMNMTESDWRAGEHKD